LKLSLIVIYCYVFVFSASYTGSSSDEDEVNPREKTQVIFNANNTQTLFVLKPFSGHEKSDHRLMFVIY
jgi:hypothetical protein